MKRLPVTEITKAVEAKAEQKVEQLAEHSLQEREVLTEAMAEVWEKQGSNQFMGVKQTTDVLEKGTWIFAGIIGVLCLVSVLFISGSKSSGSDNKAKDAQIPATSQPTTTPPGTLTLPTTTPTTTPK